MKKIFTTYAYSKIINKILSLITMPVIILFLMGTSLTSAQNELKAHDENGDITFTPGLRIQPRYEYNGIDNNNDFYIARVRIKGKGNIYNMAGYAFEIKLDNTGKFNKSSSAAVENAWFDFPIDKEFHIRTGFYDIPFSRNALTSDSKLLLIDRSMIKDALTSLGFADNTIGVFVHGRPLEGRLSYAAGVFDNLNFEVVSTDSLIQTRKASGVMTSGRLVYDFLDPALAGGYGDYRGSYVGKGRRLSIGANAAYLPKAEINSSKIDIYAVGADIFFNTGPVSAEAEYDLYSQKIKNGINSDVQGTGWYIQSGYLFFSFVELAARYQELDPDNNISNDKLRWTTIGMNFYLRSHNLKIQTDYTFKNEQGTKINNDVFQIQLQLDF